MNKAEIFELINAASLSDKLKNLSEKILDGKRISEEDCHLLYRQGDIGFLGILAEYSKKSKSGEYVFFNRNIHVEPTNYCMNRCKFCSYRKEPGEPGFWDYSKDEILKIISEHYQNNITEVHIVGGVHPDRDLYYYTDLLKNIKSKFPALQIKAFTAVELDYMIRKAGISLSEGLRILKESGLDAIPGGGAEIFNEQIRSQICDEKAGSMQWLDVHRSAHMVGIPTNATMLYGHIENYEHRVDHLNRLRVLQDQTGKFQAFIPLKYRNKNNELSHIRETLLHEDLKNFAISRIFLDNFLHIKAYWPMLGKESTGVALSFGVDDIDGTIDDTTRIYSMAGAEEQKPVLSEQEMIAMIKRTGKVPAERDTLYKIIKEY